MFILQIRTILIQHKIGLNVTKYMVFATGSGSFSMKNASGTLLLPKLGRYFKLICARTRRERAKYTVQSTRVSAEVFEPLSNKVIAQIRKKYPRRELNSQPLP